MKGVSRCGRQHRQDALTGHGNRLVFVSVVRAARGARRVLDRRAVVVHIMSPQDIVVEVNDGAVVHQQVHEEIAQIGRIKVDRKLGAKVGR